MLIDLLNKNRSFRRFDESYVIESDVLKHLVELARLTPSSVNWQPLRLALINDREKNALIFDNLAWAGLLKEWKGPAEGERPSAYVVILTDTTVAKNMKTDVGIVAQTMMLGAAEKGLGGMCYPMMVGSCIISFTLSSIWLLKEKVKPVQLAALIVCLSGLVLICTQA